MLFLELYFVSVPVDHGLYAYGIIFEVKRPFLAWSFVEIAYRIYISMFGKKQVTVVTYETGKLIVDTVSIAGTSASVTRHSEVSSFAQLRQVIHGSSVRILLSEHYAFHKELKFSGETTVTVQLLSKALQETFPESYNENFFDWNIIRTEEDSVLVQVVFFQKEILSAILKEAASAGIRIDSCEAPSVALARLTSHVTEPFLLVYPDEVSPRYIFALSDGKVLAAKAVESADELPAVKEVLIKSVRAQFGLEIKAIGDTAPSPVIGLARKTDIPGRSEINESGVDKPERKKYIPYILIVGVLSVLGFFGVRYIMSRQQALNTITTPPGIAEVPTPTPIPSIDRTSLSIQIQNGSGVTGAAGLAKTSLTEKGYQKVETGNADAYTYSGVTVKAKTQPLADFLASDLKNIYPGASASSILLDASGSFDAVVIVGKE